MTDTLSREANAERVRGVIQLLRGRPGVSFQDVRDHCNARGDDMELWPKWALEANGYVTEESAALLIYDIMALRSPDHDAVIEATIQECARVCDDYLKGPCPADTLALYLPKAIRSLDRSKINAAPQDASTRKEEDGTVDVDSPLNRVESATSPTATPSGAAPDVRELLREWRYELNHALLTWPNLNDFVSRKLEARIAEIDAALLAQPAAAGVSEERIREIWRFSKSVKLVAAHEAVMREEDFVLAVLQVRLESHSLSDRADRVVPEELVIAVDRQGIRFGKWCWFSHEKITGCEADHIQKKHRQYWDWCCAMLAARPKE